MGYLVGASSFLGIYKLNFVTSAMEQAERSIFMTGSGTRLEFDLNVSLAPERMNGVVDGMVGIYVNNTCIGEESFQLSGDTLRNHGCRLMIMPMGLQAHEEIDVKLTWIKNLW